MSNAIDTRVQITAEELADQIVAAYALKRPLMIHGSPGLGKSWQAYRAAEQLAAAHGLTNVKQLGDAFTPETDYGYFDVRPVNFGPEEFGLPSLDKERGLQVRNPVDWFPSTDRMDLPERGTLIFEEAVSASPAVQTTMFQITHDRRLGDKKLKPGWQVVLTGNLITDGGVVFKMPTPLANRMIHVYVRSDLESWTKWAIDYGIEDILVGFVRFRSELLNTFSKHVESKSKDHAFATERTWHIVDDMLKQEKALDRKLHPALYAGVVGNGPATEFNAFRGIWESMPSIDGILLDPHGSPVPDKASVRFAVSTALASRATAKTFAAVLAYADRLPDDYTIMIVKDCMHRKGGEITSTEAFIRFAATPKYADLLK